MTQRNLLILLCATCLPLFTIAQPGGRGGFFGRDSLEEVKAHIKASDEEWKVIGPLLRNQVMLRNMVHADRTGLSDGPPDSGPGFFRSGGRRGGGGFGGPGATGPGGGFGQPGGAGPGGLGPPREGSPTTQGVGAAGNPQPAPLPGGIRPPGVGRGPMGRNDYIAQAISELQATLADSKSTPEEVARKVAEVRKATLKAKAELEKAEKELLLLLTADQQVVLVNLGYLD